MIRMNPAAILTIEGTCHAVNRRQVPAVEARPERRDEAGTVVSRAVEPRAAYETTDVTVLTTDGGFASVVLSDEALRDLGGELPEPGKPVSYAVRCFVKWTRYGNRSASSVGFSVAGDLTAKRAGSRRLSSASAAS